MQNTPLEITLLGVGSSAPKVTSQNTNLSTLTAAYKEDMYASPQTAQ